MPQHFEKKKLPYSTDLLYTIVAEVKNYPQFLPWIKQALISNQNNKSFDAKLTVAYNALIQMSYTSRVHLLPSTRIEIEYLAGPFHHLENYWTFKSLSSEETEIEFFINFSFKSSLLQNLIEGFFKDAVQLMLQAFEERAKVMHRIK